MNANKRGKYMIKNIVFDLGNVLLKGSPSIVLENLKLKSNEYQNLRKFFENWKELDLGNETLEDHIKKCKFDSLIDKETEKLLLNYYKYRPFNNEMLELMNRLKHNGYNIFILSNNNKEVYEYLKKLPMFKCVDGWVVSCNYSVVKPDEEIYIKLFETFNIRPEESYFIDDSRENIKVAQKLGMKGFVFDNICLKNSGLIEDIRNENINL